MPKSLDKQRDRQPGILFQQPVGFSNSFCRRWLCCILQGLQWFPFPASIHRTLDRLLSPRLQEWYPWWLLSLLIRICLLSPSGWWRRPSSGLDRCCLLARETSQAPETPATQQHPKVPLISASPDSHAWECWSPFGWLWSGKC